MKHFHIAYVAGFFDGEGCVRIHSHSLSCKIGGSFKNGLLEKFKSVWGGILKQRKSTTYYKNQNVRHKDQIYWELSGQKAYDFLKSIKDYCYEKEEQINLAIRYHEIYQAESKSGLFRRKKLYPAFDNEVKKLLSSLECNIKALKKIKPIYNVKKEAKKKKDRQDEIISIANELRQKYL